jgi:hypothetical protein
MLQIVQQGTEFRAGRCHTASNVSEEMGGSQSGARVTWKPYPSTRLLRDGVLNAEGNMIVGATSDDQDSYILMRLAPGPDCAHVAKPAGSGQNVLVLTEDGSFNPYPPAPDRLAQFPGYRFVPLSIASLRPKPWPASTPWFWDTSATWERKSHRGKRRHCSISPRLDTS